MIDLAPVSVRRDLSGTYAQVALLAHGAVAVALAPIQNADAAECFKPTVAERDPRALEQAYEAILHAVEDYHTATTGGRRAR